MVVGRERVLVAGLKPATRLAVCVTSEAELLVAGDSVADGARFDGPAWPARVGDRVGRSVRVAGSMGWEFAEAGERALAALDEHDPAGESTPGTDGDRVVLVQAGHNDCQLSGGDPRVTREAFAAAAAEVDERLAADDRVARHAFVGLVPMGLRDGVPLTDQPGRSERYDAALAAAVETHLSIRDACEWDEATVDGVHPNEVGHAVIADRVLAWLTE